MWAENSDYDTYESDKGQELECQLQDFEWGHAAGHVSWRNAALARFQLVDEGPRCRAPKDVPMGRRVAASAYQFRVHRLEQRCAARGPISTPVSSALLASSKRNRVRRDLRLAGSFHNEIDQCAAMSADLEKRYDYLIRYEPRIQQCAICSSA